jgi:hypothetical protein
MNQQSVLVVLSLLAIAHESFTPLRFVDWQQKLKSPNRGQMISRVPGYRTRWNVRRLVANWAPRSAQILILSKAHALPMI